MEKAHFIGVAGAGMSALAQFHAMGGGAATGSDRTFDAGGAPELKKKLVSAGVKIIPQDGSALDGSHGFAVMSTAVEKENPDIQKCGEIGLEVRHRADVLAAHVADHKTIAVTGTSGKSTVVAMIFEILEAAGKNPSVITGGALLALEKRGLVGNAFRGNSDILIVEADESDGTVVKYHPWIGVLLNVSKDHKDVAEVLAMFRVFKKNSSSFVAQAGIAELAEFEKGALTYGFEKGELKPERIQLAATGSKFLIKGIEFNLPIPGKHNIENALAAIAACQAAGVELKTASKAIAAYQGVARRFQKIGEARGIEVVDDFAHNPVKVAAALAAAHLKAERVHAVFQLHGFTPARFMKDEFIEAFAQALGPKDVLWLPEIFYAGGTASKTISADDYAKALKARGNDARFFAERKLLVPELAKAAKKGDLVVVMGARDPSLPEFAREILKALLNV